MPTAPLFRTVAERDHLKFWSKRSLNARKVAEFLDVRDIAKMAGVARASVRFDKKIPKEVLDRMSEIANICDLVAQHFKGDAVKTSLWFKMKNPLFGNAAPRDMIRWGRSEKVQQFVLDAVEDNVRRSVRERGVIAKRKTSVRPK